MGGHIQILVPIFQLWAPTIRLWVATFRLWCPYFNCGLQQSDCGWPHSDCGAHISIVGSHNQTVPLIQLWSTIRLKKEKKETKRKENIYFSLVGECIFLLFCPPTNKEVEIFTDDIPPLSLFVEARLHMIRSLRVCVESLYSCAESTIEQLNIMQVSAKK